MHEFDVPFWVPTSFSLTRMANDIQRPESKVHAPRPREKP